MEAEMRLLAQEDEEDKRLAAQIRGSAQKDGPKKRQRVSSPKTYINVDSE
jgi:hypothetical protein